MYPYMNRTEIIRVNGENGARAYQMAPNSSALLLDETAPVVWLAQTDGAGYKQVTAYKIEPVAAMPSLEERVKRLEERMNESYTAANGKPGKPADGIVVS